MWRRSDEESLRSMAMPRFTPKVRPRVAHGSLAIGHSPLVKAFFRAMLAPAEYVDSLRFDGAAARRVARAGAPVSDGPPSGITYGQ